MASRPTRTVLTMAALAAVGLVAGGLWSLRGSGVGSGLADRLGLSQGQAGDLARPVEPGDIVFLGDSITAGGDWRELFPGLPVRNHGWNADQTPGVLGRLDPIAGGLPAKVFLMIGTNDLHGGRSAAVIASNVATTLRRIREVSPATRLYLQSVLPRADGFADEIRQLNRALREVAEAGRATWIDLHPHFADASGRSIQHELTIDGLHLSRAGYARWRSRIQADVVPLPPGTVTLERADDEVLAQLLANPSEDLRLINVWATWCTPCLTELPWLADLTRRSRGQPLEVVTLCVDVPEQREAALDFLTGIDGAMRNYLVDSIDLGSLAERIDPEWRGPLPYTVLLAPGGAILYSKVGAFDPDELERQVQQRLREWAR